jgi:hypothetical protein
MVCDRQSSTPRARDHLPAQCLQQRLRVPVRNRQRRYSCNFRIVFQRDAFGVLRRAHSRSQRVAGIIGVRHRAALYPLRRPRRPLRKGRVFPVAILLRIGINDAAHRPMLRRHLRLDAAPRVAIARNHNRALHGNSHLCQRVVIFTDTVIHVHQRSGHVAVRRVGIVRRQRLCLLVRCGVHRDRRLRQLRGKLRRLH